MARKAQEEIVGFVLIVVLLVIVGVIFLGIRLRNPEPTQRESELIYMFLESTMEQTTDCKLSETGSFLVIDSLIRECHSLNSECVSGEKTCEVARNTLGNMLNATWQVGSEYPFKGYELNINYFLNSSGQLQLEDVLNISSGLCENSYSGSSYWIPEFPGSINTELRLCS